MPFASKPASVAVSAPRAPMRWTARRRARRAQPPCPSPTRWRPRGRAHAPPTTPGRGSRAPRRGRESSPRRRSPGWRPPRRHNRGAAGRAPIRPSSCPGRRAQAVRRDERARSTRCRVMPAGSPIALRARHHHRRSHALGRIQQCARCDPARGRRAARREKRASARRTPSAAVRCAASRSLRCAQTLQTTARRLLTSLPAAAIATAELGEPS